MGPARAGSPSRAPDELAGEQHRGLSRPVQCEWCRSRGRGCGSPGSRPAGVFPRPSAGRDPCGVQASSSARGCGRRARAGSANTRAPGSLGSGARPRPTGSPRRRGTSSEEDRRDHARPRVHRDESLCAPPIRSSATDAALGLGADPPRPHRPPVADHAHDVHPGAVRGERNRLFRTRLRRAPAPSGPPPPPSHRAPAPLRARPRPRARPRSGRPSGPPSRPPRPAPPASRVRFRTPRARPKRRSAARRRGAAARSLPPRAQR